MLAHEEYGLVMNQITSEHLEQAMELLESQRRKVSREKNLSCDKSPLRNCITKVILYQFANYLA